MKNKMHKLFKYHFFKLLLRQNQSNKIAYSSSSSVIISNIHRIIMLFLFFLEKHDLIQFICTKSCSFASVLFLQDEKKRPPEVFQAKIARISRAMEAIDHAEHYSQHLRKMLVCDRWWRVDATDSLEHVFFWQLCSNWHIDQSWRCSLRWNKSKFDWSRKKYLKYSTSSVETQLYLHPHFVSLTVWRQSAHDCAWTRQVSIDCVISQV